LRTAEAEKKMLIELGKGPTDDLTEEGQNKLHWTLKEQGIKERSVFQWFTGQSRRVTVKCKQFLSR